MSDEWVALMTDGNGAPPGTETVTASSELYGAGRRRWSCTPRRWPARAAPVRPPRSAWRSRDRDRRPGRRSPTQFAKAWFAAYNGADPQTELDRAARIIDLDYQDNDDYDL